MVELIFLTNIHGKLSFEVVFTVFPRLLNGTGRRNRSGTAWGGGTPPPPISIKINTPALHSLISLNCLLQAVLGNRCKGLILSLCITSLSLPPHKAPTCYILTACCSITFLQNNNPHFLIFSGATDRQYGAQWIPKLIIQFHNSQFPSPSCLPSREQQAHRGMCSLTCGLSESVSRRVRGLLKAPALNAAYTVHLNCTFPIICHIMAHIRSGSVFSLPFSKVSLENCPIAHYSVCDFNLQHIVLFFIFIHK